MNYFIIFYKVVTNKGQAYCGRAMKATRGTIFIESEIIPSIEAGYRYNFPDVDRIRISVLKVRATTFKVYSDFYKVSEKWPGNNAGLLMAKSFEEKL